MPEDDAATRMTDAMTHRGPNDAGLHMADGVALGVRRLSIVDVEGGHQPFSNEDGTIWAVQNGELYNHARLRTSLRRDGHRFRSRCDTEILPHLYEEYGTDVPGRILRGMFGDRSLGRPRRDARCSRATGSGSSRSTTPSAATCSSSPPSSRACWRAASSSTELDYEAIDAYLTFGFVPGPTTPLAASRSSMPGLPLVVERDGGVAVERVLERIRSRRRSSVDRVEEPASGCSRCSRNRCGCG